MATKITTVEAKPITKELATWLYNLKPVPGERTIKQARIGIIKADLGIGNVITFRWVYATCDGVTYRINGQHTSYLLQNGEPIPPAAMCTLEHYNCDTIDDVCKLWALFDSSTSSRTNNEITSNFQRSRTRIADCRSRSVMLCKSALSIEHFGAGYTNKVSAVQKLDVLAGNEDFVLWADELVSHGLLKRVGVAYAMLRTWRKDADAATTFWNEVKDGTNHVVKSGSRKLQYFLMTTSVESGNGARTGKKTATWCQIATVAITCWNYWRTNKQLSSIIVDKEMPEPK